MSALALATKPLPLTNPREHWVLILAAIIGIALLMSGAFLYAFSLESGAVWQSYFAQLPDPTRFCASRTYDPCTYTPGAHARETR